MSVLSAAWKTACDDCGRIYGDVHKTWIDAHWADKGCDECRPEATP